MLINPSIYNVSGRLNNNYDPFSDRRYTASTFKTGNFNITNSLTSSINQAMNNAVSNFSSQFNASLKGLNKAANALSDSKGQAFQGRTVENASKAFTVSAAAGAKMGANALTVSQVATKQKNTSAAVAGNEVGFSNAKFSLTVEKEGKSKTIDLTVKTGESNSAAMERFAKTINESDAGVTAKVSQDQYGYAKLELESNTTGKDKGFKVSGTLADTFKLNDNQTAGQDLVYELNGTKGTQASNTITTADKKTTINVKGTTEGAQTFTVKEDTKGMAEAVKAFANAYNEFVDATTNNNNPLVQSMAKQFKNVINKSLDKMGIEGVTLSSDGKMAVNETELNQSLQNNYDEVKNAMMKFDSFTNTIERRTETVLKSPVSNYMPEMESRRTAVKPFIYNYDKLSALNNLNNFGTQGSIIDISL